MTGDPIAEQAEILGRVTDFVNGGVRAGRISSESAELLIAAAEKHHDQQVTRLRSERPDAGFTP